MGNIIRRLIPISRYLLIIWVLLIITSSSIPGIPTPKIETAKSEIRLDYIIHFIEYAGLAFLAVLSFTPSSLILNPKRIIIILAGLIVFALADEFHQLLIPDRTFNPVDIASNIAGLVIGALITYLLIRDLYRSSSKNP